MHHYVEQYRDRDGLITGREDITDYTFAMRERIERRIGGSSYPGYSVRRITSEKKQPCFPPIESNPVGVSTNPRKG